MRSYFNLSNFLYAFFACTVFWAINSCNKPLGTSISQVQQVDTTITDSTIYFDITLNGTRVLGVQKSNAGPYLWGTITGINPVDPQTYGYNRLGSVMTYQGANASPAFAVAIGNYDNWINLYNSTLPANFVDSFFAPGSYSFSTLTHDTTISYLGSASDTVIALSAPQTDTLLSPGVNILWSDNTGTLWQTFKGTADQTGSYFNITAVSTMQSYPLICMITANFACKLYDGHGNVIILTNGKGRFIVTL